MEAIGCLLAFAAACVALAGVIALAFLPSAIAYNREHTHAGAILALNLLAGWTGLGWIVALCWALTAPAPACHGVERGRRQDVSDQEAYEIGRLLD